MDKKDGGEVRAQWSKADGGRLTGKTSQCLHTGTYGPHVRQDGLGIVQPVGAVRQWKEWEDGGQEESKQTLFEAKPFRSGDRIVRRFRMGDQSRGEVRRTASLTSAPDRDKGQGPGTPAPSLERTGEAMAAWPLRDVQMGGDDKPSTAWEEANDRWGLSRAQRESGRAGESGREQAGPDLVTEKLLQMSALRPPTRTRGV
ncbi:hypothetical protein B0J11DRAFT_603125 [Dendryphion nanum]|uniref:Uncharacterized protein n=1 Tax=Dendryphion nanum TaxID=256645 RepID=A0A9P9E4T2_9PLEO|nr:hypothetical protein B0J11DRAFT_603125 [Dendryphion nanum]